MLSPPPYTHIPGQLGEESSELPDFIALVGFDVGKMATRRLEKKKGWGRPPLKEEDRKPPISCNGSGRAGSELRCFPADLSLPS